MPNINNLILVLSYPTNLLLRFLSKKKKKKKKKIFHLVAQVMGLSLTYTMSKEWFSIN